MIPLPENLERIRCSCGRVFNRDELEQGPQGWLAHLHSGRCLGVLLFTPGREIPIASVVAHDDGVITILSPNGLTFVHRDGSIENHPVPDGLNLTLIRVDLPRRQPSDEGQGMLISELLDESTLEFVEKQRKKSDV